MQEKQKELFEQYDMELLHVRRGRGGFVCETSDGAYDLQTCQYSPRRLEQAFEIKKSIMEQGFSCVDQYLRNKEGELLSYDRYQTPYIMKKHFDGRECDIRNDQDIKVAGSYLGNLHRLLKKIPIEGYPQKKNYFNQKNKELLRTRQYIAKKNEKKEFEKKFQQYFSLFYEDVHEKTAVFSYQSAICHGSYHQHHLLMLENGENAIINFEKFYVGNQLEDLFQLMRKVLEKNQYQLSYADALLQGYTQILKLEKKDYQFLYYSLAYPEKYWKLANQYMNHRKSFLSPKLTEKLMEEVSLQEKKKRFLKEFKLSYL